MEVPDPQPTCTSDAECDDDFFCNGPESCQSAVCVAGTPPCDALCDDESDTCYGCVDGSECDDGNIYTTDRCANSACSNDPVVCDDGVACTNDVCDGATGQCAFLDVCSAGMECDTGSGACVAAPACETDDDCVDDDVFCNGLPFCNSVTSTCVTRNTGTVCGFIGPCDEEADRCIDSFDSELCIDQCVDAHPICTPHDDPDQIRGFQAATEEVTSLAGMLDPEYFSAISGSCDENASKFLAFTTGYVVIVGFYAADSGSFLGQRTWSDALVYPCEGKTHWPEIVDCDLGTIDAVIAGADRWSIGDRIDLRAFARIDDGESE